MGAWRTAATDEAGDAKEDLSPRSFVLLGMAAYTGNGGRARVTRRRPSRRLGTTGSQPSVSTTAQASAAVTSAPKTLPVRCARAGAPPAGSTSRVMGDIDGDGRGDLFYLPRTHDQYPDLQGDDFAIDEGERAELK